MKKIFLALTFLVGSQIFCFGQSKPLEDRDLKNIIIGLENDAWKAWQNKNSNWYKENAIEECLWVTPTGVSNKNDWIKTGASACDVNSYTLTDYQLVTLNKNSVVITYTAKVDAICGNYKLPNKMRASVSYVKRKGKWLEAFYMEMPIGD